MVCQLPRNTILDYVGYLEFQAMDCLLSIIPRNVFASFSCRWEGRQVPLFFQHFDLEFSKISLLYLRKEKKKKGTALCFVHSFCLQQLSSTMLSEK